MNRKIVATVVVLFIINLLPYACRLYRGFDWAVQYVPEWRMLIPGLMFIHLFASVPALLPILALWLGKRGRVAFWASFVAVGVGLVLYHHDFDLSSDAQAPVGLVFIPIYASLRFGAPAFLLGMGGQWIFRRARSAPATPPATS